MITYIYITFPIYYLHIYTCTCCVYTKRKNNIEQDKLESLKMQMKRKINLYSKIHKAKPKHKHRSSYLRLVLNLSKLSIQLCK